MREYRIIVSYSHSNIESVFSWVITCSVTIVWPLNVRVVNLPVDILLISSAVFFLPCPAPFSKKINSVNLANSILQVLYSRQAADKCEKRGLCRIRTEGPPDPSDKYQVLYRWATRTWVQPSLVSNMFWWLTQTMSQITNLVHTVIRVCRTYPIYLFFILQLCNYGRRDESVSPSIYGCHV